jgi:23S rRNA U2552 (ribose-2'-O)-methylase RlmE/FtsJ
MLKDWTRRFSSLSHRTQILRGHLRAVKRGYDFGNARSEWTTLPPIAPVERDQFLLKYFNEHTEGRGIWKFVHYFDIYERHFSRFRGKEVHVLEIGVFSGGSLEMWKEYFGPRCTIYGVDIEPGCKAYESESVRILIGDQADRNFWRRVKEEVPAIDIVIDDGGHTPEQQIVTLEELLPHLRAGGVYMCEDVTNVFNEYTSHVHGLTQHLNAIDLQQNFDNNERRQVCTTGAVQSAVGAVHLYPFATVIERNAAPVRELVAPKHGTQWEPFLK